MPVCRRWSPVIPPLSAVTMVSWAALFLQFWKRRNLSILERYLQTNPCLDKTSLNYAIEFELDNHMLGISQLFALLVIILGFLKAQRGAITSPSRELALFQVLKPFFTCRWELRLEEDEIHARMPWDSAEDEPLIEQHAQAKYRRMDRPGYDSAQHCHCVSSSDAFPDPFRAFVRSFQSKMLEHNCQVRFLCCQLSYPICILPKKHP
jgi:hypothetical protein